MADGGGGGAGNFTDGQANPYNGGSTVWDKASNSWMSPEDKKKQTTLTTLTPEQLQQMNAQTNAYAAQTAALQAQIDAQNKANKAGPELQYNPLNDDGTLKDQWKLGSADSYTAAIKKQEAMNGVNARDAAATQGATATAQAKENLAMRGGAGSNNAALLEAQGMKNSLAAQQAASNQSAANQSNIDVQGAGAQLKIDQANMANQNQAATNVNTFNLDKYNQNMAVDAADKQANATVTAANSGGK